MKRTVGIFVLGCILGAAAPASADCVACDGADQESAGESRFGLQLGALKLSPMVLLQIQSLQFIGKDTFLQALDAGENEGFRIRRARLGFDGLLHNVVPFSISTELAGTEGSARLLDAWFGISALDYLQLKVGAHKMPFSATALAPAALGSLIERPFGVRAMAPFRQVGLQIFGHLANHAFGYHVGTYNGLQRSDTFFGGYVEDPATLGNRFGEFSHVVRLTTQPLGPLGPSIYDRDHSPFKLGIGVGGLFSDGDTRDIVGLGADLHLKWMGAHLLAEYLWNRTLPESTPSQSTTQTAEITSMAISAELGYVLEVLPLGATVRFEWLDPNNEIEDESDSWILTAGVNYSFLDDLVRLQLDYTHREELHGVSLANDSVNFQFQLGL